MTHTGIELAPAAAAVATHCKFEPATTKKSTTSARPNVRRSCIHWDSTRRRASPTGARPVGDVGYRRVTLLVITTCPVSGSPVIAVWPVGPMARTPSRACIWRESVVSRTPNVAISVPVPVPWLPNVARSRRRRDSFIHWCRGRRLDVNSGRYLCRSRNDRGRSNRSAERTCDEKISEIHHAFFLPPDARRSLESPLKHHSDTVRIKRLHHLL